MFSLPVMAAMMIAGIVTGVLAVHFLGGAGQGTLNNDAEVIARFQQDYPESVVGEICYTQNRQTAFCALPDHKAGIVHNLGTFNPLRVAFHEWVGMLRDVFAPGLSLRQRLMYMAAPPGWSHDGSRKTSEDLKADYVRLNPDQAGKPGLPDKLR